MCRCPWGIQPALPDPEQPSTYDLPIKRQWWNSRPGHQERVSRFPAKLVLPLDHRPSCTAQLAREIVKNTDVGILPQTNQYILKIFLDDSNIRHLCEWLVYGVGDFIQSRIFQWRERSWCHLRHSHCLVIQDFLYFNIYAHHLGILLKFKKVWSGPDNMNGPRGHYAQGDSVFLTNCRGCQHCWSEHHPSITRLQHPYPAAQREVLPSPLRRVVCIKIALGHHTMQMFLLHPLYSVGPRLSIVFLSTPGDVERI